MILQVQRVLSATVVHVLCNLRYFYNIYLSPISRDLPVHPVSVLPCTEKVTFVVPVTVTRTHVPRGACPHVLANAYIPTLISISKEQHNTVYVWANALFGVPCNNNSRIYTDCTLIISCCCHLLPIPLHLHTYCWHHTNHTLLLALRIFCRSILTYFGSFLSRLFVGTSSPFLRFFRCVLCQQF